MFRELIAKKIVLTYMDDLIIPTTDRESTLKNLKIVLETASQFGLSINWKKCRFLQEKVEFLGHVIENGFIRPAEHRMDAVKRFP